VSPRQNYSCTLEYKRSWPVFPQKLLRLLRAQAPREVGEIHQADWIGEQKPHFIEDLNARMSIKGQAPACSAKDEYVSRLPASGPEAILKFANPPICDFHGGRSM
jgi:hypothetical protein